MFAPQASNEIPNILINGSRAQADIIVAGASERSKMINQAGQTAGSAVGSAVSKWQTTAAQTSKNAGVLDAYSAMNTQAEQATGKPVVSWELLNSLSGEKNQDKISGTLMAVSPVFDSYLSQTRQIAVADASQKSAYTPRVVDLGNGRQAFMQSNNSAQILTDPKVQNVRPIATAGGYVIPSQDGSVTPLQDESGNPIMPVQKGAGSGDPARAAQITALDAQIAGLKGEVAGGNKKWGPDWLPGATPYADQLRSLQAERDSLAGSGGAPAGVPAQQGGGYASPQAVQAAVKSGQLTPQQGVQALRAQWPNQFH